jgi:hypothetical protein
MKKTSVQSFGVCLIALGVLSGCQFSQNGTVEGVRTSASDNEVQNVDLSTKRVEFLSPVKEFLSSKHEDLTEPSGIVYHTQRQTYFIVDDSGEIFEVDTDRVVRQYRRLEGLSTDLEGVTFSPVTGLVYILVESSSSILELDPETFEVQQVFSPSEEELSQSFLRTPEDGNGLESIALYEEKDGVLRFLLGRQLGQSDELSAPSVQSVIVNRQTREMNLGTEQFFTGVEASGLWYDWEEQHFLAINDQKDLLFLIERGKPEVVLSEALPASNQEGVTMGHVGELVLAQDSGGVVSVVMSGID